MIAGGVSTCDTSSEKFRRPRFFANDAAIAFAGAVVSNPMAKKTTARLGLEAASFTASSGE